MCSRVSIHILKIWICAVFNQEFHMINFIGKNCFMQRRPFHFIGRGIDINFVFKQSLNYLKRRTEDSMVQKRPAINVFESVKLKRLFS